MEVFMSSNTSILYRIIAAALAVIMLLCSVACGSNPVDPKDTEAPATEAPDVDPLEGLNFKGEVFTIHSSANVIEGQENSFKSSNYLIQGADEVQGDKASDAAIQRNKLVEENLNVKLNYIESDYSYDIAMSSVRDLIKGGADNINLIINDIRLASLCTEGMFHDASYGRYFDFEEDHWYDNLMDSIGIEKGTRYVLMGDYFIDIIRYTNTLLFSKSLYTKLGMDGEVIYDYVRNQEWTLDKMTEILRGGEDLGYTYNTTYIDRTGNKKRDRRDTYGLVTCDWWGPLIPFFVSADPGYITRNDEGYPELNIYNDRSIALTEKLTTMFHLPESAIGKIHNYDMDDTITAFIEDRALFLGGQMLGSLESEVFANSEVDFAILPYPKLDEFQKNYVSPIHDTAEVGFIPSTVSFANLEVASAVIESLCRESTNTVIPKYYESTLKIRYARESANAEMIQLIRDNYDSAFAIAWYLKVNDYTFFMESMLFSVMNNDNQFASHYKMYENAAQGIIDDWISDYEFIKESLEQQYTGVGK